MTWDVFHFATADIQGDALHVNVSQERDHVNLWVEAEANDPDHGENGACSFLTPALARQVATALVLAAEEVERQELAAGPAVGQD